MKYVEDTPIAAINDLLFISGNGNISLNWDYSSTAFKNAEDALMKFLKQNGEFLNKISKTCELLRNLW